MDVHIAHRLLYVQDKVSINILIVIKVHNVYGQRDVWKVIRR